MNTALSTGTLSVDDDKEGGDSMTGEKRWRGGRGKPKLLLSLTFCTQEGMAHGDRAGSEPVPRLFYGIAGVMRLRSFVNRQNVGTRLAPTPAQVDGRVMDGSL